MAAVRELRPRTQLPHPRQGCGLAVPLPAQTSALRVHALARHSAGGSGLFGNRTLHEKEDDR
ncbi:hypothetical protein SEA_KRILI_117 [Mycobacterium phage Krili]|nr:hypothetical protein SEA_KRILI_117 [Mycobacterium phage Krili]